MLKTILTLVLLVIALCQVAHASREFRYCDDPWSNNCKRAGIAQEHKNLTQADADKSGVAVLFEDDDDEAVLEDTPQQEVNGTSTPQKIPVLMNGFEVYSGNLVLPDDYCATSCLFAHYFTFFTLLLLFI